MVAVIFVNFLLIDHLLIVSLSLRNTKWWWDCQGSYRGADWLANKNEHSAGLQHLHESTDRLRKMQPQPLSQWQGKSLSGKKVKSNITGVEVNLKCPWNLFHVLFGEPVFSLSRCQSLFLPCHASPLPGNPDQSWLTSATLFWSVFSEQPHLECWLMLIKQNISAQKYQISPV